MSNDEKGPSGGNTIHRTSTNEKNGTEKSGSNETAENPQSRNLNAVFENPLANVSREQLERDVDDFCNTYGLTEDREWFIKGALVAQDSNSAAKGHELSDDEKRVLQEETTNKWRHPWMLYWLCCMCSLSAATQGMDETANNGAVAIYPDLLGISNLKNATLITGLVVSAPYLACFVLGCWLTQPINRLIGRRGAIFVSCLIAAIASIWEAVVSSWPNLFVARFVLGLGIGTKSSTTPVYCAECAPAPIRGALVMQWQVWTAFGIMLGNIAGVAFSPQWVERDLAWRLMLGSTVVLPLIVCAQVYFCPESPRWLITKGKVPKAYRSFQRIRNTKLQAARDLYYAYVQITIEQRVNKDKGFFKQLTELFTVPRNRRAAYPVGFIMFGQQFCGVNVIAYYSTTIFEQGGYSLNSALLASMGTGILNWLFALPAFFTIDTFGRRPLLIFTFPFLALFLLWTGFSFFVPSEQKMLRTGLITAGMYLYECFYSPGMGPVPFSYSAEAFPIQVRDVGMSYATATTWCFNWMLSMFWPVIVEAFTPQGGFAWWAGWCIILWINVILFMPETKELTLEELDQVFSVPTWKHTSYQIKNSIWHIKKYLLFQRNLEPLEPFYQNAQKMNAGSK